MFGFLLFFLPLILFKGTGEKIFKEAFQVEGAAPAVQSAEMAETKANVDAPAAADAVVAAEPVKEENALVE